MNVIGAHSSASNIFSQESGKLSAARSVDGGLSESELRDLSRKDANADISIRKDELEYEYSLKEWDQMDKWEKEEAERTYGIFKD